MILETIDKIFPKYYPVGAVDFFKVKNTMRYRPITEITYVTM